jgi:signal transduction histidine kinase
MGKVTLQRERLDLAELAERVLETWRQTRRNRAARTESDLARVWIHADRVRVEQILLNLLDNAEKFSSAEERITVRVGIEGEKAVLQVRDQGQGIAPEEIPHIFKLFVQGPQSFHRPQGGLGLGLTLVQRLAEMHGGDVSVFSAGRGQGATFTVRLPVAEAPGRATSSTEPRADDFRPQGRRILLVEDNEDGRHMMETLLTLEGHMVRTAATGRRLFGPLSSGFRT